MRNRSHWLLLAGCAAALCACNEGTGSSPKAAGNSLVADTPPRYDPGPVSVAYAKMGGGSDAGPGGADAGGKDAGRAVFDGDTRDLKDAPGTVSVPGGSKAKTVPLTGEPKPDTLKINEPPGTLLAGPFEAGDLADPVPRGPLDRVFYHYAACSGVDWRFLKAVAIAESSLRPKNRTGKYVGLFQFDGSPEGAASCSRHAKPFASFLDCTNLEDPEVNTALAANRFDGYFRGRTDFEADGSAFGLLKACPRADAGALAALAYVGHNNGPGVLGHIMARIKSNKACLQKNQEAAVRDYYRDPKIGNTEGFYEIPKPGETPRPCHNQEELKGKWSYHCVSEDYGAQKWKYGVRRVAGPLRKAGVSKLYPEGAEDPALCPAKMSPPRRLTSAELSKTD